MMPSRTMPACVQNAMVMKERKPFTYTPGGLDLSQIKSEKMAKRLMRNAMSEGVPETPKTPTTNGPSMKTPTNYYNMPVAVFPSIQIPTNAKDLLRKTNGPNRRNSFENDTPSPKIQEKPVIPLIAVEEHKDLNIEKMEETKLSNGASEAKENIPVDNEQQIKKTIKIKKPKERTGMKLRKKISTSTKSEKSESIITNEKGEQNRTESLVRDKINDIVKEEIHIDSNDIVSLDDLTKSKSIESEVEVSINIKIECTKKSETKEVLERNEIGDIEIVKDRIDIRPKTEDKSELVKLQPVADILENKVDLQAYCNNVENKTDLETNYEIVRNKVDLESKSKVLENEVYLETNTEKEVPDLKPDQTSIFKDIFNTKQTTEETKKSENINYDTSKRESNFFSNESTFMKNIEDVTNVSKRESSIKSDQSDGDVTPVIDTINYHKEPAFKNTISSPIMTSYADLSKSDDKSGSSISCLKSFIRENSEQINSKRKSEHIKSLHNDLNSLPSLNLCSKRFSFLDNPSQEDDPFSILTGISAKLTSTEKTCKNTSFTNVSTNDSFLFLDKNVDDIPKINGLKYVDNKFTKKDYLKPEDKAFENVKIETNSFEKTNDLKIEDWNSPKLYTDFSFSEKDDNTPAWKKELLAIANQKKDLKDDDDYFKESVEPPWRKELRELAQARVLKESAPSNNVWNKLAKKVETSIGDEPLLLANPVWSQTIKPKTWKERKADLTKEKEVDVPEWKNATILRRNFMNTIIQKSTSSSSSCSSPGREVRKTPEIMIEVTGQPLPAQEHRPTLNGNGYTNPWESSSESSTTFSPEPYGYERTPTPQSRSSPLSHIQSGLQSPVIAREFGSLNCSPNRKQFRKSCPIQSRSFKYLQMLTGTSDGLEDDEPFIPQSPQHSHLKPDNV